MIIQIISLIGYLLSRLIDLYIFLIVIYCLLSWIPSAANSKFGYWIAKIVYPYLRYFESLQIGMIGLGPMLGVIALWFIQYGVIGITNILIGILA
ncbi:YggT family protein [Fructilactobacillus vespulae]|uniref:YggT family protein n=1 Tax=Fructilactobacillus vespulae TaxID=1249630 RepID=UPI0039B6D79E